MARLIAEDEPSSSAPRFEWRREWPWAAAVGAVGLAVRAFIALNPWAFLCGDVGVIGLVGKHIWRGQSMPLFSYGQAYGGALSEWMMAPIYGLVGADVRGVVGTHLIWFAIAIPVLYRLLFAVGGRWGAITGLLALGLGTRPLLDTAAMIDYFELLPIAAALYLVADHVLDRGLSDAWAGVLGLLMGVGCWLSPQFVSPCLAVAVVLLASSPLRSLLRSQDLGLRVGVRQARAIRIGLAVGGVVLLGSLALVVHGSGRWMVLGCDISAEHPVRYLFRSAIVLSAAWCGLELAFSARRRALVLGLAGVLGGQVPLAVYRITGGERLHRVPLEFSGDRVGENLSLVHRLSSDVLFGQSADTLPAMRWVGGCALAVAAATATIAALIRMVGPAWRLVGLRPTRLGIPAMFVTHAAATLACMLLYAGPVSLQERYFVSLWLPYLGALAAAAGWLARRGRAAAVVLLALVAVHYGRDFSAVADECLTVDLRPRFCELEVAMASRTPRATLGYADYDLAYLATYLSDERIRLVCLGGAFARDPHGREAAARERNPVAVFDEDDGADLRRVRDVCSHLIVDEWTHGHFTIVRMKRPKGGWIQELQGDPPAE